MHLWMTLTLGSTTATAAELVPHWEEGAARAVKIDLFEFAPGVHIYGSDWKITVLEQWTAVLDCRFQAARVEVCTFPHGVWWSYVLQGSTEVTAVNLGSPGTIEIEWSPRGRVSSWDVRGDEREAFWEIASNTSLKAMFHRSDVVYKPDGQREIGQTIEASLTRQLAGALEWELPKKGDTSKPWRATAAPWFTRRWTQGTASAKVELRVESTDADGVHLALAGRVSEVPMNVSVTSAVETQAVGRATLDPATGLVVSSFTETLESCNQPLTGHTRHIALVSQWRQGDPVTPAEMPTPLLK